MIASFCLHELGNNADLIEKRKKTLVYTVEKTKIRQQAEDSGHCGNFHNCCLQVLNANVILFLPADLRSNVHWYLQMSQ